MEKFFICKKCGRKVPKKALGTKNRNHCPFCLWSYHVDEEKPGDRKSSCHGLMEPLGLTFKHEGFDKYGNKRKGELMIIHYCLICGKISINRLAGDDNPEKVMELFEKSLLLPEKLVEILKRNSIEIVGEEDRDEVKKQLYGDLVEKNEINF